MKNDFDAIRAATTEPPREGMMRTTKKTSSSAPKNTATNRFKRNRGKGGDEERKREFQRQMDQFKRMEEKPPLFAVDIKVVMLILIRLIY